MIQRFVLLFAQIREIHGHDQILVDLPDSATVVDLRSALQRAIPQAAELIRQSMIALDEDYVADNTPLGSAREIACIPPVSGG